MLDPNTIPNSTRSSSERGCSNSATLDRPERTVSDESSTDRLGGPRSRVPMDIDSFSRVFREQQTELKLYATKIVGSHEIAEDIVNEVFTKTYHLVSEGKQIDKNTIAGWLLRCVRNSSINAVRKRQTAKHISLDEENGSFIDSIEISDRLHTEDRSMQVLDKVSTLPNKQRKAFLLYDVRGLDYKETAELMGTTANSVRQLLFRARRNIRNSVGPETAGLAAPMLRTDLFGLEAKSSLIDRISHYVSDLTVRYSNYFNQMGERLALVSTPAVAALLFGAAIVISQAQSEDFAQGAVLDPAMLILGINVDPVGSTGLVPSEAPAGRGDSDTSVSNPWPNTPGTSDGSNKTIQDVNSAFFKSPKDPRYSDCDPCPGTIIGLFLQTLSMLDVDREEIFDVRHERRQRRRTRKAVRKNKHVRRAYRREMRREWHDSHQTTPSGELPDKPSQGHEGNTDPDGHTTPDMPEGQPRDPGSDQTPGGSGNGGPSPSPLPGPGPHHPPIPGGPANDPGPGPSNPPHNQDPGPGGLLGQTSSPVSK